MKLMKVMKRELGCGEAEGKEKSEGDLGTYAR